MSFKICLTVFVYAQPCLPLVSPGFRSFFLVFQAQVSFGKPLYREDGDFQMQPITCDNPESFHYPHFADEKTRGSDLKNDLT